MVQFLQKLRFVFLLGFLLPSVAHAQEREVITVFGYDLGMHLDSVPKTRLQKMGIYQKLLRYDRTDEQLSENGMGFTAVRLYFWDNHLHSIEVKTSEADGDTYKALLKALFGEGKKLDAMGFRYQWYLPTARILWDQNLVTHAGTASFVDERTNNSYFKFMNNRQ